MNLHPSARPFAVAKDALRGLLTASATERRLAAGMFWTLAGTTVSRGALFVAALLLARMLGVTDFGQFGAIETTIGMFAVLGNLGLSLTATKFVAKYRRTDLARAGRVLAMCNLISLGAGTLAAIGLIAAAPWLARHSLAAEALATELRIGALILLFSTMNGTLSGGLTGFHAFRATARINFITGLISLPLLAGGAATAGLRGAVVGLVVVQGVNTALLYAALHQIVKEHGVQMSWRHGWSEFRTLLGFSMPALINSSLIAPVNWFCVALLVNEVGGYSQMGLLQVANGWFLLLMFVPGKLSQVYYPMLEELLESGNSLEAERLVWRLTRWNCAVSSVAALGVSLCAGTILQWYGPRYAEAEIPLVVTMWTAVFVATHQPMSAFVIAKSRIWHVALCSLIWAVVNVAAAYALIGQGAVGISLARLAAYSSFAVLIEFLGWRLLAAGKIRAAATLDQVEWQPSAAA